MPAQLQLQLKLSSLLHQCTLTQLNQIHALIITSPLTHHIQLSSKLLRRSTEFGAMHYPNLIFSQMSQTFAPGAFLYNIMLRGFAHNGPHESCIKLFDEMSQRGLNPNNFTYPYVLKALAELGDRRNGESLHCRIVKAGFACAASVSDSIFKFYLKINRVCDARKALDDMVDAPVELWNRVIVEYGNTGDVQSSREVFNEMPERDTVSWNSMISCYARAGDLGNARELFRKMPEKEKNVVSWTSMLGAYAGSGDLKTARMFFDEMPEKNVVSWNSMIASYTQHGKFQEALELFVEMHRARVDFDEFTLVSVLTACGQLGDLEFGKWIHFDFIKDWSRIGVIVATALIEMYAKCGDVDRAFKIFIKLGQIDVFCWNVMIKSLAVHGRVRDAIKNFSMMNKIGLKPNDFTFASVLFACNHGGLVEEGRNIFYSMEREFGISPKLKHYGCFIDLLCRNGLLEEAQLLLRDMPFQPDIAIWGALLGGCRVRNDINLAEKVMEKMDECKASEPGLYVLLSNMHASVGQWPEAAKAREKMEAKKLLKKAGYSSVAEG